MNVGGPLPVLPHNPPPDISSIVYRSQAESVNLFRKARSMWTTMHPVLNKKRVDEASIDSRNDGSKSGTFDLRIIADVP